MFRKDGVGYGVTDGYIFKYITELKGAMVKRHRETSSNGK